MNLLLNPKFHFYFWFTCTTFLCLLPGKDMPEINIVNFDKLGHFAVFGILHFLFIRIIGQSSDGISTHFLLYNSTTAMLVIAYGGLMEWMQGAFYTDRSPDIYDVVANATGVLISFTLVSFFPKLVHHKMGQQ